MTQMMTVQQVRAMALGRELDMWNTVRARRAALMRTAQFGQSSPAFQSAFLTGLAQIDQHRRVLRPLLRDALEEAGYDQMADNLEARWSLPPRQGRHRAA